jgi:hypothetical protein
MDDDAILLALGKLQGQMDGIGREIGDLKKLMAQSNQNCISCKTDLCGRISYLEINGAKISQQNAQDIVDLKEHVDHLEVHQSSNQQVSIARSHWIDSAWAKVGMVVTIALTIINFVRGTVPL